jgi:hypothetical protein
MEKFLMNAIDAFWQCVREQQLGIIAAVDADRALSPNFEQGKWDGGEPYELLSEQSAARKRLDEFFPNIGPSHLIRLKADALAEANRTGILAAVEPIIEEIYNRHAGTSRAAVADLGSYGRGGASDEDLNRLDVAIRRLRDIAASGAAIEGATSGKKPPSAGRRKAKTSRRRRTPTDPIKPLTPRQAEYVQTVSECQGNMAEAGRRLAVDRKTVAEGHKVALAKLGKKQMAHTTKLLKTDRRGQADIAAEDDRRE